MKCESFLKVAGRVACALGAVALIAGTSPALSQTMDKKHSTMPGMAAAGDMHGSMKSMMKNMESMKMSGDADKDFAMMMKVHHQGAIDMAEAELQSGKDAKMRAMAKGIIKAQQKEIKEIDKWLAKQK